MLSLQLCLSIAPLLAGSEGRHESLQSLSHAIPYHLIAQADGRLPATPVVLVTDDDDDDEDEDDDEHDGRRDGDRREEHEARRDGSARRPAPEEKHEGDRRAPEGHRPEARRPEGPGRPHGPGEHKPQPDHKGPPHQPQHGQPSTPPHGPQHPGGFRPPMMGMGMPIPGRAFGGGSPFGGMHAGQPSGHGPGSSVLTGIIFELLDQNHDGNLSRGEFQKLADAVQKSHHPPMMPARSGPGEGPDQNHGRPQLSRRMGPPMIHQPFPLMQAHKPDGDHRPEGNRGPEGDRDHRPEHDRKPEHRDNDDHREHGENNRDRLRPDGERGERSREHQEPRI